MGVWTCYTGVRVEQGVGQEACGRRAGAVSLTAGSPRGEGALLASCLCSQFFLLSWQKHREGGSRQFELWPQIGSIELGSEAGAVAIGESDGGDCF